MAMATICEKTLSLAVSNYRGELIGGVITTLVLWLLHVQATTKNNFN
jgi:hypothetical protein